MIKQSGTVMEGNSRRATDSPGVSWKESCAGRCTVHCTARATVGFERIERKFFSSSSGSTMFTAREISVTNILQ